MLPIEKWFVSLKWAQNLKASGYSQEGAWYWVKLRHKYGDGQIIHEIVNWCTLANDEKTGTPSAYDLDESALAVTMSGLGKALPGKLSFNVIAGKKKHYYLTITKLSESLWNVAYVLDDRLGPREAYRSFVAENLADALARMWCCLKEAGLI